MSEKVIFQADSVKVNGPLINGSISITFQTGEYAWDQIKELPNFNNKNIKVTVGEDGK